MAAGGGLPSATLLPLVNPPAMPRLTSFLLPAVLALALLPACTRADGHPGSPEAAGAAVADADTTFRAAKARLTPMQRHVTQENGTEPPFRNAYDGFYEAGIYVDVVSGEPLFSSLDKFDSGTGWPSFTRPLEPGNVREVDDGMIGGMEVRSVRADSHLGHVFPDGPAPTGLRYCMNSAAMRFVPAARLRAEGYGRYAALFD